VLGGLVFIGSGGGYLGSGLELFFLRGYYAGAGVAGVSFYGGVGVGFVFFKADFFGFAIY